MKRPKHIKPKTWKLILQVREMNKRIVKEKKKKSLYVPNAIDELFDDEK